MGWRVEELAGMRGKLSLHMTGFEFVEYEDVKVSRYDSQPFT
jgi:hypothetical protein